MQDDMAAMCGKVMNDANSYVEGRLAVVTKKMEEKMDFKIEEAVRSQLNLPDLVGEGKDYSTFAHFMTALYRDLDDFKKNQKIENLTLISQI